MINSAFAVYVQFIKCVFPKPVISVVYKKTQEQRQADVEYELDKKNQT
jgi:hypothetical protein